MMRDINLKILFTKNKYILSLAAVRKPGHNVTKVPEMLHLCQGQRVRIIQNIATANKICNGVNGYLRYVYNYEVKENPFPDADNVEFLLIELDNHPSDMPFIEGPLKEKLFPLARINLSKYGIFEQFAVMGSNCMTYGLIQGLTFEEKVILCFCEEARKNNHLMR